MKKFLLTWIVLIFSIIMGTPKAEAITLDLSAAGSSGSIGDVLFRRTDIQGTGSGVFDPFVRVHQTGNPTANPTENGYNTDGTLEFDTVAGVHTHSIQIGSIPLFNISGNLYREFVLDAGEPGPEGGANNQLDIDIIELYLLNSASITGYAANIQPSGQLKYSLDNGGDNKVILNNIIGNGSADLFMYVPDSYFTGTNTWLYFYTDMSSADGTFEEWGRRINLTCKETNTCDNPTVPEPTSMLLFGTGLVGAFLRKRKVS